MGVTQSIYSPEWIALCREAAISGQSIDSGLTALRKANYAATGFYSHAFFGLSIGIERLLKLLYILDYRAQEDKYPTDEELKKFGHDIENLYAHAVTIHKRLSNSAERYPITEDGIEKHIIKFLGRFAKTTRYYNLDYLTNNKNYSIDPIKEWYNSIGSKILNKHYSERQRNRNLLLAAQIAKTTECYTRAIIHHTAEDGTPLRDLQSATLQSLENKILQRYGTFYCAKIVRFLYMILYDLGIVVNYFNHWNVAA